jgi:dynamin 1-like protein
MLLDYTHAENTIILAVTAANQDLATSDALQLARRVDPDGHRTIGVVTKLDLMDRGTEQLGLRMLMGESIPLRLGYIGIVNRSQADIDAGRTIHEALEQERRYFHEHDTFRVLADRSGTSYLAHTCNRLLSNHIQRALPGLRKQVGHAYNAKQLELEHLGAPVVHEDTASLGWLLLHMINRISDQYRLAIDGEGAVDEEYEESEELNGGARLRFIFHDTFAKQMESIDPLDGLSATDIKTAIRNAAGT